MRYRYSLVLLTVLAWVSLTGTGCTIPCDGVREDADQRYDELQAALYRGSDPGGNRYDVTLAVPAQLLDDSFQRMLDSGAVETHRTMQLDLPVSGLSRALDLRLQADLEGASFEPVAAGPRAQSPARLDTHLDLRLRGRTDRELFDVKASIDGPIDLQTRNGDEGPQLFVSLGDLESTQLALSGDVLGQAFLTELEGLLPSGGLGKLLGAIGGSSGGLPDELQQAIEQAVQQGAVTVVEKLLDDTVGDVKVMDLGTLELGKTELEPTAVGLRTGDGWVAVGLRTTLDAGPGQLDLAGPSSGRRNRVELHASESFLEAAVGMAIVEGQIPRSFDDKGVANDEGPQFIEPLGLELGPQPSIAMRIYRCEEPCGWADLSANFTTAVDDQSSLQFQVGDIAVDKAKGAGKLVELVLWHQEKVIGEPVELVQSVSGVMTPKVAGQSLILTVTDVQTADGELTLHLNYEMPIAKPGKGGKGGKGGKSGKGTKTNPGGKKTGGKSGSKKK